MDDTSTTKSPPEEWHVGEVEVTNWGRVRHIRWTPVNGWNEISGETGQGKTFFIGAVLSSLMGKSPGEDIVRHGEDIAISNVRLDSNTSGCLYIEKLVGPQFPNGWELSVRETPQGKKLPGGQAILNRIVGAMVDVSRLASAKPAERVEMLMRALGLGDALRDLEAREKHLVSKREDKGRQGRDKQGELEGIPVSPGDTPADFVDTVSLLEMKNGREAAKRQRQAAVSSHAAKCQTLEAARVRDRDLNAQAQGIDSKMEIERCRVAEFQAITDKAVSDIAPIQSQRDDLQRQIEALQAELKSCDGFIAELSAVRNAADREVGSANERMVQLHRDGADFSMKLSEYRPLIVALDAECETMDPSKRVWPDEDTTDIDLMLSTSKEVNAHVANNKRRSEVAQAKREIDADWDRLDGEIKATKGRREELLAAAPWPYPGMAFGNGDLMVDGCLWVNLSEGQTVIVSTAFSLAMNPHLKVVVLTRAAWLTPKSREIVRRMARDAGYQAIVEIPGDNSNASLFIEDGCAVGATTETAEKELAKS